MDSEFGGNAPQAGLPSASPRRSYFSYILAAVLLLGFGALRLPVETRLAREQRGGTISSASVDLSLRAKLGQLGFLAALSGISHIGG